MVVFGAEATSSLNPRPTCMSCGRLCIEKRNAVLVPRAVCRICGKFRYPKGANSSSMTLKSGRFVLWRCSSLSYLLPMSSCFRHLFPQYLFVNRHDEHIVEVELQARVHEHPHNIREVIQLVLAEKLVVQVERTEHHVYHRHVVLIATVEWVVPHRYVRPGGVQNTQLLQAAGMVYVWEKTVKEFHVTLAVKDHHRYVMAVFQRSDNSAQILRNDVAQQGRLSRSGHPQHNSLHHPDTIGPQPWLAMYVVAQHNGILRPGFLCCALVSVGTHSQRWMGPLPLSS